MYRGSLVFGPNPYVAYDFNCLMPLKTYQKLLMRFFPNFYFPKITLDNSAMAEIRAIEKKGFKVEIFFWDTTEKTSKAMRKLSKRMRKKVFLKHGLECVFIQKALDLKARRYDRVFTNRQDLLGYFTDDLVSLTQFSHRARPKRQLHRFGSGIKVFKGFED